MNELYLKCIDDMISKAKEQNEFALLSILYSLKGSIVAKDTKTMADYVFQYTEEIIRKIEEIKKIKQN